MSRARSTGGRIRALIFLILSFGAAIVAAIVIYVVIISYQSELNKAEAPVELDQVMVAAKDMWQGKTIEDTDLAMTELPPEYVPEEVLKTPEQAVGRVPRERILEHEFIRNERLADPAAGIGLNAIIPRGMRAMSINITDGSAVSGFLNPGNYVDVLVTIEGEDDKPAETVTLLQAVTVLAVNNRLGDVDGEVLEQNSKPSVTLAVTPDLAEKLTHAVAQGSVTLTLRNDIDVTQVETHGALVSNLLGSDDAGARITVREWAQRNADQSSSNHTLMLIQGNDTKTENFKR
jgi:pilus assembly protein CpaB